MHKKVSELLLYSHLDAEGILFKLSEIFRIWQEGESPKAQLRRELLMQVKRLLDLATENGFDENLWYNYLTWLLMTQENSFSLSCERVGYQEGSVNHFARSDAAAFRALFHYDFAPIEADLELDCFTVLRSYQAIPKKERRYNKLVSQAVQALSRDLGAAQDDETFFQRIVSHYETVGVGTFGLNQVFRIRPEGDRITFLPVHNTDETLLDDLVGYDIQKKALRENTEAFLQGYSANNALLYGDSGTGKSTSVRALINEYHHKGLRMIEIYKHQFTALSQILTQIKNRNYFFIIFIDDLSFENDEVEYKFLKAVIEGGVETRPENVLIYATSNRRHLIRETWKDRNDMEFTGEVHRSDTVEEKLSLSSRFGVLINYSAPNREEFRHIVLQLARRQGLQLSEEALYAAANKWELRHGGVSGRTAQQFISDLAGKAENR